MGDDSYSRNGPGYIETRILRVSDLKNEVNGEIPGEYRALTLRLTRHEIRTGERISPDQEDCFSKATIRYKIEDLVALLGTDKPEELQGREVEATHDGERVLKLKLK